MSAIKIARGYGWMIGGKLFSSWRDGGGYKDNVPVHIIYGLSDAVDALPEIIDRAQSIHDRLNPKPCEGHTWARCADLRDGGRLYTCECGHQTRVSGPSATEIEALAREVLRCVK